jgi:hypothetical protein
MATTTPNYGWTVPTSTDLVKDGATAIETLGDAIDASMNTALGTKKAGMVLLNTTSFSGVSAFSVSDIFSADYNNYRILMKSTGSGSISGLFRLRVAGADLSTTVYSDQTFQSDNTTLSGARNSSQSAARFTYMDTSKSIAMCDLFAPFLAETKLYYSSIVRGTSILGGYNAGFINQATSYTGLTFITSAGTFTGEVSIYGYNK